MSTCESVMGERVAMCVNIRVHASLLHTHTCSYLWTCGSMCPRMSPVGMATDPVRLEGMWPPATVLGAHHLQKALMTW